MGSEFYPNSEYKDPAEEIEALKINISNLQADLKASESVGNQLTQHIGYKNIEIATLKYAMKNKKNVSEYQLCPKCHGDGNLSRYNSPNVSNTAAPICDLCNGLKMLVKPMFDMPELERLQKELEESKSEVLQLRDDYEM